MNKFDIFFIFLSLLYFVCKKNYAQFDSQTIYIKKGFQDMDPEGLT